MSKDLSTSEAAAMLGNVSQRFVQDLIKRGHFPGAYKMDPTRKNSPFRIPETEVEKFLKLQRQPRYLAT